MPCKQANPPWHVMPSLAQCLAKPAWGAWPKGALQTFHVAGTLEDCLQDRIEMAAIMQ